MFSDCSPYQDYLVMRLMKLRTDKGVSARDMSLSIGLAENYINQLESKRAMPSMGNFFLICEYLGVTPGEFFDETNEDPQRLRELNAELKKLDYKELEQILWLVQKIHGRK